MNHEICVVEDNHVYGNLLRNHLARYHKLKINLFPTGRDFLEHLKAKPGIICLDYGLPDYNGSELLEIIKKELPDSYVIVVSSQPDLETVAKLIKSGAHDYIKKGPDTRQKLNIIINNILEIEGLKNENRHLREIIDNKYNFRRLIQGTSREMNSIFELMGKASGCNFPVFINGETGTGKELVAQGIHYNSDRKDKPFIPVNVSAIPSTLIESELFGHEKGAFTGATQQRIGKFELASGGTLFLDEIGDLSASLQTKLLRVIQEKELTRIGGNKTIKLDVRLISATHQNIELMTNDGSFREDLYFRIRGLPIHVPPLRDRGNDALLLAQIFIKDFCEQSKIKERKMTQSAIKKIQTYRYPGNVRELKSAIELACVLSGNDTITVEDLKFSDGIVGKKHLNTEKTLKEHTFEILSYYLDKYNKNIKRVGETLDISRPTLYRMIKEMNEKMEK